MSKKTKKKSNHSIVPVIFTLGVIGWGFFAIDRLTAPATPDHGWDSSQINTSHNRNNGQSTWKHSLKSFLSSLAPSTESPSQSTEAPASIPIMPEPELTPDSPQPVAHDNHQQAPSHQSYYLYFYREQESGKLHLERTTREGQNISLKDLFTELVHGPSAGELGYQFLDSFPVKPTLLEARREGSIMIFDFDDNFGVGVSFQTLDLQIKQLYHTARQFPGIDSIQILIDGRPAESLGGDGLTIPKVINERSWPIAMN